MADGRTNVLIMGAAGRDFHNFNTYFRDNEAYEVVAFTAIQIPYTNDRRCPAQLAGKLYPDGIRIHVVRPRSFTMSSFVGVGGAGCSGAAIR